VRRKKPVTLAKPPLVEVWMSFRFEPAVGSPTWTRDRYRLLLDTFSETHPNVEEMTRHAIQVAASKRGGRPQIKEIAEQILAMRARTEDGLRAIQMGSDELVVNYLRGDGEPYPGFPALLEEAMTCCRRYADCYHPVGVLEAALHYVDLVEIPVPEHRILRSEEYLTLDFRVPEEVFGHFAAFEVKAVVLPPGSKDTVQLSFATVPGRVDDPLRQFRLEWHTASKSSGRMTEEEVRASLQTAHDRLEACFRHAFTAKGWALFEPGEP